MYRALFCILGLEGVSRTWRRELKATSSFDFIVKKQSPIELQFTELTLTCQFGSKEANDHFTVTFADQAIVWVDDQFTEIDLIALAITRGRGELEFKIKRPKRDAAGDHTLAERIRCSR